ncbi:DUF885 domain-containing protein [Fodinibius halophilus]|uniref:DUF885 domain-containing protein n=1 Tax=Fodinibius halophilus TaxID=1736908 RepID=A0A6M1TGR4_9BACT|nr:DUF885 domain-containing protein [Fodinibius halophilus]NGP87840.1 DUF885 domain-containing protein [Fodinibius halophilus]
MAAKFQKLKEELKSLEQGEILSRPVVKKDRTNGLFQFGLSSPGWIRKILLAGFLGSFLLYAGVNYFGVSTNSPSVGDSVTTFQNWVNQPDEELLQGMGAWMEEMGYTDLSKEDLIELREQGVTATYTLRIRDLGYTDLTLDEVVRLQQNDVSSTFAAMMKELGYNLTIEDLIELRQHDVTAYFTSNLHDLGYTDITTEELIRLKDTGVSTREAKAFVEQQGGELPSIEELIRHHISNQ